MKKFLLALSFLLCFSLASEMAEAKSVTWSSDPLPQLNYFWRFDPTFSSDTVPLDTAANCGTNCGWGLGLTSGALAQVAYRSKMVDFDTKNEILDGSSVPIGTKIEIIRETSSLDTDISWFGSGKSFDSPYGRWVNAAGPVPFACRTEDLLNPFIFSFEWIFGLFLNLHFNVYVLLNVNPPLASLVSPSPNLSCLGMVCTVVAPGPISAGIRFDDTYGRFYYRYYTTDWIPNGCSANNVPMRPGNLPELGCGGVDGANCLPPPEYTLSVPAQTITFNLTAVSSNNPPTIPTVIPQPFSGNTSTSYPFTFTSTDPDNDQIAYEVDWNNDSLPDESTLFVLSGTSQSLSNPLTQWIVSGTYPFKVRAKDNQGGFSPWATPSVTLATIVNGTCGLASGFSFDTLDTFNPALCASGTQTNFLSTGTGWTWGCNGSGGGTSTLPNACTATTKTYILSAVKNLGPSAAGTIIDTTPTAMSIDSTIPRNTESVPYNSSRTLRANPTSSSISWSGCTSISGNDCTVNNIIADKTVTATFTRLSEPGICGSSNTQSFETLSAGSSGLCSSGAVNSFSLSGTTYSWNCNGSFGSAINVSCSASQKRNYNWIEVRP